MVMPDLMRNRIDVGQLLVEFYHRRSSMGGKHKRRMLHALDRYGMDVCYVSPRADVFALIRRSVPV
jgi:hypothetical protein